MPKVIVNGKNVEVEKGMTVLQACELADAEIPRFCYHEKLSIAGNCRMCLVEIEKSPKPVASCAMPISDGMVIKTNTEFVEKARKGVMEFLLANHPLDCPVCDQGGECDLQDQSLYYGVDKSRFKENKRKVEDKYMGPLIKTQMTRCIHCTRCVRFVEEVAGIEELGAIGRGENMEITTYLEKSMQSELSANVIDLCPVGALTSKPYAFEARPWELKKTESVDISDAVGSNIRVDSYGWEVKRILPRLNEDINEEWISDKARFSCDGLLKQRLDTPYKKEREKFVKISWDEAMDIIHEKIKVTEPSAIAGHVGDLVGYESTFGFLKLFNKLNSVNLEFREKDYYINSSQRLNYLFNTSIKNIEESDCIILIGTNPRTEATMINARIRKAFLKNKTKIYSFGDPGDLTYEYEIISENTNDLKNFIENKNKLSNIIKSSRKPMVIFGESFLELKSAKYFYEGIKKFLLENNFIGSEWNALNVIFKNASSVAAIDLIASRPEYKNYNFFKDLKDHKYKIIYLLGSDNLEFKKTDEFVIYHGSHGDKGAEKADLILPSASFTEQNNLFINIEGRVQECKKATYPPGGAKSDLEIFNLITKKLYEEKLFTSEFNLRELSLKNLKDFSVIDDLPDTNIKSVKYDKGTFSEEKIFVNKIDYYFSNAISRASKTMAECKRLRNFSNGKSNGIKND